ncbi:neuropeptide FF receptor 2-like [Saccostrea echinata]|uniref:neuropeptide FF receptor 2-like n=1 Tax=Saccostrea echinata TaxID=191078 RepID=UPI002A83B830|nr:neuropeptide FF receptor 2-like [Saccostrea echinata]
MEKDCNAKVQMPDLSQVEYIGEIKEVPAWEMGVKITIGVSIELVAIVGNLLMIIIIVQSPKMRNVTNYYILNLAISDMLVGLFAIWIHLVDDLTQGWVLGSFLCKFNPFMQITAMCASVFTLVAIAGDRFFAIVFPLKSRVTQRKVSVIIIVIWLAAIAIALPVLFFYAYMERPWKNFVEKYCTEVWPQILQSDGTCDQGKSSRKAYWICLLVVLNWVPMLLMMIAYTVIFIKLRKTRRVSKTGRLSMSVVQQRSKKKVVKMLFAILVVFIFCVGPFQVTKLFEFFRDDTSESLPDWYNPFYFAAVTLLYTNSALNPVLYGGLNDNFRNGLKGLMNNIFRRKRILTNSNGVTRNSVISTIPDNRRESEVNILSDLHIDPKRNGKKNVSYVNPVYEERSSSD